MTNQELYNQAKEAYYNGQPIMEDFEFDELEKSLGLENKSYIGTKHNPSYTIKHPFIMGSLSKIQVHEQNGKIDYDSYIEKIDSYLHGCRYTIMTPKYDGCSFEVVYDFGHITSISTRGDGNYGKDIYFHIHNLVEDALSEIDKSKRYVFRGEVLINKNTFLNKYSDKFVNPRSFVSGVLNNKPENITDDELSDLSIIIYDVRVFENDTYKDLDWIEFKYLIDDKYLPKLFVTTFKRFSFKDIYTLFESYRNNTLSYSECDYALDGFVIKPLADHRKNNLTKQRPSDCVAIKFVPQLQETEVVDIEWNISKTGEYIPVVITKPVVMDGKVITRASGSNYGNLLNKKISIGTKVILSLAGDIIPFIYKITDTSDFDESKMNLPESYHINGIHLMANISNEHKQYINFISSVTSLGIPGLGDAEANNIWNYIKESYKGSQFFDESDKELPENVLELNSFDIYEGIVYGTKNGATGKATKIKKEFEKIITNLTLTDIIKSCNFKFCGQKVSEQCANYILNKKHDFSHLASEGYNWCTNSKSENYIKLINIINKLGRTIEDFNVIKDDTTENVENKIPVILTGEPNNYKSKSEFLKCNPQYRQTGSWKEVQIVFTNSLDSNTGKMKKAREKNIKIKIY